VYSLTSVLFVIVVRALLYDRSFSAVKEHSSEYSVSVIKVYDTLGK